MGADTNIIDLTVLLERSALDRVEAKRHLAKVTYEVADAIAECATRWRPMDAEEAHQLARTAATMRRRALELDVDADVIASKLHRSRT